MLSATALARRHLMPFCVRSLHQTTIRSSIAIKMPSLSPTMTSGTIVEWLKNEGDEIMPGDVLAQIQTDKAVVALETEEEGILAKIVVKENTGEIEVGKLIAVLAEDGEDWKTVEIPADAAILDVSTASAPSAPSINLKPAPAGPTESTQKVSHLIGPAVRMLLHEYGLEASQVPNPTGPKGTLTKGDVLQHIKTASLKPKPDSPPEEKPKAAPPATPVPPPPLPTIPTEGYTDIQLSNMRKTIAKRLTESKQSIPHAYATIGSRMNNVMKLRRQMKDDGHSVTVNDFIVKASAAALKAVPMVNSQWQNNGIVWQPTVDVSVAVATPSGLITPIVKNADCLGLAQIASTTRELAARARENKLQLHEFQGGTFTVSNLGMMGITEFTAIINPPQAAILAIGGAIPELACAETKRFDQIMHVTLCYDTRVVQYKDAAKWLRVFQSHLETPELLLSIDPMSPFNPDVTVRWAAQDQAEASA